MLSGHDTHGSKDDADGPFSAWIRVLVIRNRQSAASGKPVSHLVRIWSCGVAAQVSFDIAACELVVAVPLRHFAPYFDE